MQVGTPKNGTHKFVNRLLFEHTVEVQRGMGQIAETGLALDGTPVEVVMSPRAAPLRRSEEVDDIPSARSLSHPPIPVSTEAEMKQQAKAHWSCCFPFSFCCGVSKKVAPAPKHHKQATVLDYDAQANVPGQVPKNRNW